MASSMSYNAAAGLPGMLKQGTRHMTQDSSEASVVLSNIENCVQLTRLLQTSLGPQGRCKLLVNHLDKIFVTSDCASIVKELPLEHPACVLLQQACAKQANEYGTASNMVLALAGELLAQTKSVISKLTWQPASEILAGYQLGLEWMVDTYLPQLVLEGSSATGLDVSNRESVLKVVRPVLQSKIYGQEDLLAPLIVDACQQVVKTKSGDDQSKIGVVEPETIRTVKLLGSNLSQSFVVPGYVATRGVETVKTRAEKAKVAVFACGMEASSTEAKGTVVMKTAQDLQSYNPSEEQKMSDIIESIAQVCDVVVTGGTVSDMALHFMDKYGLVCCKVASKWELRRLCQATQATALVRLGPPTSDELGYCDSVRQEELGGRTLTIFENKSDDSSSLGSPSRLATIVLRASTMSVLNDLERAVDDGVRAISTATQDGRLVYGGGATEMALSIQLQTKAEQVPGLEQYALGALAKALQVIPRTLAENAGWDAARVVANLQAAHATHATSEAKDTICDIGVDVDREDAVYGSSDKEGLEGITGMKEKAVVDLFAPKLSAIRLAIDVVITILKIDQIIMSKPAGGPKG